MIELEYKIQPKALFPRLKQKSINDNTMYTIQLLRKTIHQLTNIYSEPKPTEMASKMLPAHKIKRLNHSYIKNYSQNYNSQSFDLHQKASTQTIPYYFIDNKKGQSDNYKIKITNSPNLPFNSIHIFQQQYRNKLQTIDITNRFKNLKNKALSQKYRKRNKSVSHQK
ncbi:unnamed protein product [Paramecium sonneborni]|uniref:Uncharacterized protein n=1 Tax=Paramecium sonneborni TaxID=65129 RepID=A0A8S1QYD2_9CILI|nr:unnamed protein product [Paramecium sonneborni]